MRKFKVGDTVKIINSFDLRDHLINKVGKIEGFEKVIHEEMPGQMWNIINIGTIRVYFLDRQIQLANSHLLKERLGIK